MEIKFQEIVQHAGMQERAVKAKEIIAKYGESTIVLFEVGDTYETYNENAEEVHTECKFPLNHYGNIAHLDFPKSCSNWVFPKMVRAGFKICIMEEETY